MSENDFDQELPQAVLAVLSHGESHGYAITEVPRQHGFTRIKRGTLYPLLKRLEDQSLVEHTWQHDQARAASSSDSLSCAAWNWSAQRQSGTE